MRKFADYETVRHEDDFWLLFFMANFPESNYDDDGNLNDFISEHYEYHIRWMDEFTGYYDGIFDECDGYLDDPTALELALSTGKILTIEFHPGDTIFFIDDDEIGCTGPHYFIRKIDWPTFSSYTDSLSSDKKLLLLPMLVIGDDKEEDLRQMIAEGLKTIEIIKESDYEIMENCIIHNCLVRIN